LFGSTSKVESVENFSILNKISNFEKHFILPFLCISMPVAGLEQDYKMSILAMLTI
jgi:hypothetical protein